MRVDPIVAHVVATTLGGGGVSVVRSPGRVVVALW